MEEKNKNRYVKEDDDDLGFLLWRVMRLWQRDRQKELEEFNITVSQLEILGGIYFLNEQMGEVTQIVLSQETGIDPMTTSTILRNLEKKKLVLRKPSKTDTRARVVELTSQGDALLFEAIDKMRRTKIKLLENIDKDLIANELKKLLNKFLSEQ